MKMKNKWYVYLLRCSDNSLYCGITNNLSNRLKQHNRGKGSKYTRFRLPVKFVYLEIAENRSVVSKREYRIKQLTKKEKELMVKNYLNNL